MVELILNKRNKENKHIYGFYCYGEHLSEFNFENESFRYEPAELEDIEQLLNNFKRRPYFIKNIHFKENEVHFMAGSNLRVVLADKEKFIGDARFSFLSAKTKNKKYKLYENTTKVAKFTISLTAALIMLLSSPTIVNSFAEDANVDELTKPISYSDTNINELNDLHNDLFKEISAKEQKREFIQPNPMTKSIIEITPESKDDILEENHEKSDNKEEDTNDEKSHEQQTDINAYASKEEKGFVVTTGNKTYELTDDDLELLMAVVAAESDKSLDDSLAVMSVILNRCEKASWVNDFGPTIIDQITAPNQFDGYLNGDYKDYLYDVPTLVRIAVLDALNGVRNTEYYGFNSNGSVDYSDNMITPTGNRYR